MIKQVGATTAYVTGAVRSAIYDFATGKVFSINQEGTKILSEYFCNGMSIDPKFLVQVEKAIGASLEYVSDYIFPTIEPKLEFAWLELTQKCNNRCLHCYQGSHHKEIINPLSLSEWKSVIEQCANINCRHIQFIGGEPSLYSLFSELIGFSYNSGIKQISIFSNLYNLSKELLSTIDNYHVSVNFSIYGASALIHDRITQVAGSFDRLMNSISQLKERQIPLRANIVMMRENEGEYHNILNLLHDLGISNIHYDEIRPVYGGTQSPHMLNKPSLQRRSPNFRTTRTDFERSQYTNTCWFGKLVVSTDGTIYPCEFERNIIYGNIRKTPLKDILRGDSIKKCWYFSYESITPCKYCEYRFACKDCRPIAYAKHGCMTDKTPRCSYDPLTGMWT